ncbi:MAG: hypothetical protein CMQ74_00755 [Gammaproteobacteria bacterium]|nr:hypothetical protein [Gammaproteobacteria bacterium]|tara:strand:- start:27 stop:503 length:477 start_codon:yes stop_codon:yes gene_type:complete
MKRLLILFLLASPANADIQHTISKSSSLTVGAAATHAKRVGTSYSISGSGIDTTDGTTANTISAGTVTSGLYVPGAIAVTQDVPGAAFSFSASLTTGDTLPTSAVTTGATPNFSDIITTASGTAGSLGSTITDQALTITAGGANTVALGQIINEIKVD